MTLLNVPISHLMTKKVVTVGPDQKLVDVKHIFEKKDFHHHVPVTENDELTGMVSLTDFLYAINGASLDDNETAYQNMLVRDIMTHAPVVISTEATLRDACKILEKGEVHALVVCHNKKIKGILSTTDVISYFLMMDSSEDVLN